MEDDRISTASEGSEGVPVPKEPVPDYDHTTVPSGFRAYIGGLSNKTRPMQLLELLKNVDPEVTDLIIAKNKGDGSCRGFAHASFSSERTRQKAVGCLTGQTFMGRKIRIEEAGEHFMVKRQREEGELAAPKRSRLDLAAAEKARAAAAAPSNSWGSGGWGNDNSWGNSWDEGSRVQQGTQRRWEPGMATAAPPLPAGPPKSARRVELEGKKAAAVAGEDYAEAARIKKLLESEDAIDVFRAKKKAAVESEDFAEAQRLKGVIEAMEKGEAPAPAAPAAPAAAAAAAAAPAAAVAAPAAAAAPAPAPAAPKVAIKKTDPAVQAAKKPEKGACKRCSMGKPCGKHSNAGPRCAKCQAGEACMKHKPEEALLKQAAELVNAKKAAAGSAAAAAVPASPAKKPAAKKAVAKKAAAVAAAPKTMAELLAAPGGDAGFAGMMNEEV
eukprot:Rhum_TRINITY_DN15165_c10_g1::Rhum_TRINITY_DN15165_c10_g1_i1::g.141689::m.141689